MLTVLMAFLAHLHVLTLIILVPVRPSRENVISMPSVRRNVCARRGRPASARGFLPMLCPSRCHREYAPHINAKGLTRSRSRWSGRP
jgi:hypothetical protein